MFGTDNSSLRRNYPARMRLAPAVLALGLLAPPSSTLYDTVKAVRRCGPTQFDAHRTDCGFDLGSLHFSVEAVGQPSGGFTVFKADWDSDYLLKYCIIASWGAKKALLGQRGRGRVRLSGDRGRLPRLGRVREGGPEVGQVTCPWGSVTSWRCAELRRELARGLPLHEAAPWPAAADLQGRLPPGPRAAPDGGMASPVARARGGEGQAASLGSPVVVLGVRLLVGSGKAQAGTAWPSAVPGVLAEDLQSGVPEGAPGEALQRVGAAGPARLVKTLRRFSSHAAFAHHAATFEAQ